MSVLWARGPSTAQEITDAIRKPPVARSSIMTMLGVLERKGFVDHSVDDRTFVFSAVLDERAARRTAVKSVLANFFGGSVKSLVSTLIDDEKITHDEIREMRRLFEDAGAGKRRAR